MNEVEKEAIPIRCEVVCVHYSECLPFVSPIICSKIKLWDDIAESVKHAGYLPVEEVKLEELGDEEIKAVFPYLITVPDCDGMKVDLAQYHKVSKATNTHNSKEKLYSLRNSKCNS